MHRLLKKNQVLTIPNILSFFRILLIPVIIWLYCAKRDYYAAIAIVVLSGITDIVDGIIARKFNMISDFGKIIDPIADKLTQFSLFICLTYNYPMMIVLVILFFLKECVLGIMSAVILKKQDCVNGAKWHGKLNTIIIYITIAIMILLPELPQPIVNLIISVCFISMGVSFVLYAKFHINIYKKNLAAKN